MAMSADAQRSDPDNQVDTHGTLLALILLTIIGMLTFAGRPEGLVFVVIVQATTVSVALRLTALHRAARLGLILVAGLLAATNAVVTSPLTGVDEAASLALSRVLGLVLALAVPVVLLADALRRGRITVQSVLAGLSTYLLLGLAFAYAAMLIDTISPGSYSAPLEDADALYLSFVTLTTVGFGDLVPVGGAARALAVLEGMLGQLYLVSVVAFLVGNVGEPLVRRDTPT